MAVCVAIAGCGARRTAPYRFRSPLVSGVSAAELSSTRDPDGPVHRIERRRASARAHRSAPPVRLAVPSRRLPNRDGDSLAATLRGFVGNRDRESTDLQFALSALRDLGAAIDPSLANVSSGRELVELARDRDALEIEPTAQLSLGDLVVFDAVVGDEPASLIGIVVTTDELGTVEFVYLARGVVRRGWVNPLQPRSSRDDAGRALNTLVRHSDGRDRRGTRYRAGQLLSTFIRLDRLLG